METTYELRIKSGRKVVVSRTGLTMEECLSWIKYWQLNIPSAELVAYPLGYTYEIRSRA